jgi:hypothetical protein
MDPWFSENVVVWVRNRKRCVISRVQGAARCLLEDWPKAWQGKGKHLAAMKACYAFLEGETTAEAVRRAVIAAAKEADILVTDVVRPG